MRRARERITNDPLPREPAYYGAMYARYLIDTELWNEAGKWLAPTGVAVPVPHYNFARAFAAAKRGQLDEARGLMAEIRTGGDANPEIILAQKEIDILKLEVGTVIAVAEGNGEKAVDLARQATQMQASMPFRYGPPRISKPTAELLGDVLLELGDNEQAALAYEDQLTRSQLRTNSLLGLARAAARIGDTAKSRHAYELLKDIWHSADATAPALVEVDEYTKVQ